jgi:hypothetical protein
MKWKQPHRLLQGETWLFVIATTLIMLFILLALPALGVPLGIIPEADAIDYRIPLVRWILRHHAYPNWSWSMVDDYPMLGELFMVPLYKIQPALARLVPIAAYVLIGLWSGLLFDRLFTDSQPRSLLRITLGASWVMAVRAVVTQSNALMVDNLASMFFLGALFFAFEASPVCSGLFLAGTLATRYTFWPSAPIAVCVLALYTKRGARVKDLITQILLASLGCLPFMVRNFVVNHGNPFFPIGNKAAWAAVAADHYGRGHDLHALLLLPWDLLVSNTFGTHIYDYTVGKLFVFQFVCFVFVCLQDKKEVRNTSGLASYVFTALALTLIWFFSAQQLRFLVPAIALLLIVFLVRIYQYSWKLTAMITLLGLYPVLGTQKDPILMVFRNKPSYFEPGRQAAASCFERAGVGHDTIALIGRDGMLGFFDNDFIYLPPHPYAVASSETFEQPRWIYGSVNPRNGYIPWPVDHPCLLKKADL